MTGRVTFVGAGPGDPDLITVRGLRAIEKADVILYDALVDRRLLRGAKAHLVYVGKRCGKHAVPQEQTSLLLADLAQADQHVVRLKGGDPAVLARLGEEALELRRRGIPFEIVPGVSSALAVPAFAGIPLTHRGLAEGFVVTTAHRQEEGDELIIPPYHPRQTLVLLMALSTASRWQPLLRERGYPGDLPLALISMGSTPAQRVVDTTVDGVLEALAASGITPPGLAVVGRVVALRSMLSWFCEGDAKAPEPGFMSHVDEPLKVAASRGR